MSWHYLQELGEDYLDQSKQDTTLSVLLSGNPIASSPSNKDRETDTFHPSPSGMTSIPLTGDPGVDMWILSLRDSPVSPSQSQVNSELVKIQGMDSPPPFESFGKLDQSGSCLRTFQVSLLAPMGTCTEYVGSWPRAAMILGGIEYLRTPAAPLTRETGSGSLATPTAKTYGYNKDTPDGKRRYSLDHMARHNKWPTPTAHLCKEGGYPSEGRRNEPTLTWFANNKWPTPTASDNRDRGNLSHPSIQRRQRNGKHVGLGQSVSATSGQLNPDWVELLMGWPKGWTSLEPLPSEVMDDWLEAENYWSLDWESDTPRTGKKDNNSSRLKAIGNGQVPACAIKAWRLLR